MHAVQLATVHAPLSQSADLRPDVALLQPCQLLPAEVCTPDRWAGAAMLGSAPLVNEAGLLINPLLTEGSIQIIGGQEKERRQSSGGATC